MISSLLQGGLGNQMFQISAALCLARKNKDKAIFDLEAHSLPKQGRRSENYRDNIFRNINFSSGVFIDNIYREPYYHYCKIEYRKDMCLNGYFQSEKYFQECANYIREVFSPDEKSSDMIHDKYGSVLGKKTVAIHVRRGDYLKYEQYHPVCDVEYYRKASSLFPKDSTFLVFSDDVEWCRTVFTGDNYVFVENNEDYIDLYLMSFCENNIIANSSFSWWGAWMNKNESKKVITPKMWFGPTANNDTKNLIPSGWRKI